MAQVKVYKLPESLQEALKFPDRYVEDVADGFVEMDRDYLEDRVESMLGDHYIVYKEVKRKKTTSYAFTVNDPESEGKVDVKIILRFNEVDGIIKSVRHEGLDFVKGIEYLVGDF